MQAEALSMTNKMLLPVPHIREEKKCKIPAMHKNSKALVTPKGIGQHHHKTDSQQITSKNLSPPWFQKGISYLISYQLLGSLVGLFSFHVTLKSNQISYACPII
jgi:hypothetical protein